MLAPTLKCGNGCKNRENLSFIGLGVILGYPTPFLGSMIPKLHGSQLSSLSNIVKLPLILQEMLCRFRKITKLWPVNALVKSYD